MMGQLSLIDIPGNAPSHNPGGKVKTALPAGLKGDAVFHGAREEYRTSLRRWIGDAFPARYVLFIGMNPSTADAAANDPTITREWGFAVREGFSGFVKCNVADFCATDPRDLVSPIVMRGRPVRSLENLPTIRRLAAGAALVVVCHGKLNAALEAFGPETIAALRADGIPLWCFGRNVDGSPKHPGRIAAATPLIPYEVA